MNIGLAIALGLAYLAIAAVYVMMQKRTAQQILRDFSVRCPEAWAEVGAPVTMEAAVRDPDRRWERFVHERVYRSRCDSDLAQRIDAFRQRNLVTLTSLAIAGAVVLYCLWQVELPTTSRHDSDSCFSVEGRPCSDLV